jgi:hypothetical protein
VDYAAELEETNPKYIRVDIKWYQAEPYNNGVYLWENTDFEAYYDALVSTGITSVAILKMAPDWAREPGSQQCDRIKSEYISDFAEFAYAAAIRYPAIRYWEVWNEEDSVSGLGDFYGCWGNPNEPDYGGSYYASVLEPVYHAIKAANPDNLVVFGGLMMYGEGSEKYLDGALKAGAGKRFDVMSFHFYTWYSAGMLVPDTQVLAIRNAFKKYGIDKPIFLTEVSMLYECVTACSPRETKQGEYMWYINDWAQRNVDAWFWYTINDSGWHHSGMMEGWRHKSAYRVFKELPK